MVERYQLVLNPIRDNGDYWEVINKAIVETWRDITLLMTLEERKVSGRTLEICSDWSVLYERFLLDYEEDDQGPPGADRGDDSTPLRRGAEDPNDSYWVTVPIRVRAEDNVEENIGDLLVDYLQEVFLVANLAAPSALNISRGTLKRADGRISSHIELYCGLFDIAWIHSLDLAYPAVRQLMVERVWKWLHKLEFGRCHVAEKGPVKALFSLLHLAGQMMVDVTELLWISYGIEGLHSAPGVLSLDSLCERLALLLESDAEQKRHLARDLRALYDMRDAFVHGAMSIDRPPVYGVAEPRDGGAFQRLLDNYNFGVRLLIGSLQSMIERDLCELELKEPLGLRAA